MQAVTLFFAILGTCVILILGPLKGIFIYLIGLCWYPQPLVVSIGTVEFSLSRILILALFTSIFFRSKLIREFNKTVPIILSTGYSTDELESELKESDESPSLFNGFLPKPYTLKEIDQILQEIGYKKK